MIAATEAEIAGWRVARQLHGGRWVAAAAALILVGLLARAFARGQIEWAVVARFLTAPTILAGLGQTLLMAVCAMALGVLLGVAAAVMRLSANPVLQAFALGYAWLFRGTPVILQLLLWFNLALIFPVIGLPGLWSARTVDLLTPFVATLLGLGLNQGAYTSEVVRAGLLSVDTGQYEAARSIGMTRLHALRRIILPQAMRVVIPPLGNEFISMIKLTSLASVIQFAELLHAAQNIYFANARVIELLLVAGFWYLAAVSMLTPMQALLERRFARGVGVPR